MATSKSVRVKSTISSSSSNDVQTPTDNKRFLSAGVCLTQIQKQSLQSTWRNLKQYHGERCTEQILQKLINDQPKIKNLFYHAAFLTVFTRSSETITTFRDHSRILYRTLDDLIENFDNRSKCDRIMKGLKEIASKHAFLKKSGFKPETWERFGEAAVDVINTYDCVKSSPEACKAWTILIASITDELRNGYEAEARRRSYSSERPKSACD